MLFFLPTTGLWIISLLTTNSGKLLLQVEVLNCQRAVINMKKAAKKELTIQISRLEREAQIFC
jgi:hypothetical protein